MKKILNFIICINILVLIFSYSKIVFAVSCRQNGNTTYCDDGTTYRQNGNTIYGSDGTTYWQNGNTTYGSDGSTFRQNGNATYGSNGVTCTQNGNKMFCSDGSSYITNGNTTYGNGGNVFNSCPVNSTYDSSSGKCQCDYGYKVEGSNCIYDFTSHKATQEYSSTKTDSIQNLDTSTTPNSAKPTDHAPSPSSSGLNSIVGLVIGIFIIKWLISFNKKVE